MDFMFDPKTSKMVAISDLNEETLPKLPLEFVLYYLASLIAIISAVVLGKFKL